MRARRRQRRTFAVEAKERFWKGRKSRARHAMSDSSSDLLGCRAFSSFAGFRASPTARMVITPVADSPPLVHSSRGATTLQYPRVLLFTCAAHRAFRIATTTYPAESRIVNSTLRLNQCFRPHFEIHNRESFVCGILKNNLYRPVWVKQLYC